MIKSPGTPQIYRYGFSCMKGICINIFLMLTPDYSPATWDVARIGRKEWGGGGSCNGRGHLFGSA